MKVAAAKAGANGLSRGMSLILALKLTIFQMPIADAKPAMIPADSLAIRDMFELRSPLNASRATTANMQSDIQPSGPAEPDTDPMIGALTQGMNVPSPPMAAAASINARCLLNPSVPTCSRVAGAAI